MENDGAQEFSGSPEVKAELGVEADGVRSKHDAECEGTTGGREFTCTPTHT